MKKTTKAIALLAASTMLAACGTPANTVFSADDLKGKKIGAQLGTTGYVYAGDVEDATVEPYNKGADAVQALKQGKLDAVIIDSEPAKAFVAKNDTLKILDDPFAEEEYAIAYKKGNDELGQKLDDALTKLKEDGTLDEIVSHWIGDNADQKSYTPDDSVERDGTLVMATNAEFPPYERRRRYHCRCRCGYDAGCLRRDRHGTESGEHGIRFHYRCCTVRQGRCRRSRHDCYTGP